jgi:hypothetical protein
VRFIGSEFTTGDRQRGRIDTLGIDQDGCPTIIEYKKDPPPPLPKGRGFKVPSLEGRDLGIGENQRK